MSNADKLDNVHRLLTGYNGGNDGGPPMELVERVGNLETDMRDVRERVIRIESRLDSLIDTVIPTLVTKAEFHSELNTQTWRIIGAVLAAAGLVFAAARLIPK